MKSFNKITNVMTAVNQPNTLNLANNLAAFESTMD